MGNPPYQQRKQRHEKTVIFVIDEGLRCLLEPITEGLPAAAVAPTATHAVTPATATATATAAAAAATDTNTTATATAGATAGAGATAHL